MILVCMLTSKISTDIHSTRVGEVLYYLEVKFEGECKPRQLAMLNLFEVTTDMYQGTFEVFDQTGPRELHIIGVERVRQKIGLNYGTQSWGDNLVWVTIKGLPKATKYVDSLDWVGIEL